jgi:Domain of unknown function (DUF4118)
MKREERLGVWLPLGAIGAVALGIALIPLRSVTSASNLAFVFVAFTIVVAELGGRTPALVTALMSAISLNFFLTQPYLSLTIDKSDDVVAFVALAGCGLIAAVFGTQRERVSEAAGRAAQELEVLRHLVGQVRAGAGLDGMLADLRSALGFGALVLRDEGGRILAATPAGAAPSTSPPVEIALDSLLPAGQTRYRFGTRGLRVPEAGGRLRLETDQGRLSLDIWEGDTRGLDLDQWRTLSIAVAILGLRFARPRAA